jgi:iron-sulfur cluster assembly protein
MRGTRRAQPETAFIPRVCTLTKLTEMVSILSMSDLLQSSTGSVTEQLTITDSARAELLRLTSEADSFVRLWVEQGGCSGMSYQAAIDDTPGPFDVQVFRDGDLRVVTDQQSRIHVEGIHVDYSDDLVKAGFRFINPRASHSCGCGQSFSE